MKYVDRTGNRYGKITVIKEVERKDNVRQWLVRCDCGTEKISSHRNVYRAKSCGCSWGEFQRSKKNYHGKSNTSTYNIWANMVQRCSNPKDPDFIRYGKRGIKVSDEWLDFKCFYKDMGERPEAMSIDRIDNNDGYHILNCRWATNIQQARNKRSNTLITFKGETLCLEEWGNRLGFYQGQAILWRLENGWSLEKALTTRSRNVRKT